MISFHRLSGEAALSGTLKPRNPNGTTLYIRLNAACQRISAFLVLLSAVATIRSKMSKNRPVSEAVTALAGDDGASQQSCDATARGAAVVIHRRLWWVLLSFAPSSLLLGVINYITIEIAAVPLL